MADRTKTEDHADRFWAKVDVADCWEWTAARGPRGYGKFRMPGPVRQTRDAHRVSWEMLVGLIPKGLELDHLCRNRACVNPDHLELVTHAENMRRGHHAPGGTAQRARTHCPRGHAYDEANTYQGRNGRKCRACHRTRVRGAYRRAREAV